MQKEKKKRCQGPTTLDMKTKICDHIWERQLDRQREGLFSNCTVQLYLYDDDRKWGDDKENPEMPHGGVKIGHLARESKRGGGGESERGENWCRVSSFRDFLLQTWDKKLHFLKQVVRSISFSLVRSFWEKEKEKEEGSERSGRL